MTEKIIKIKHCDDCPLAITGQMDDLCEEYQMAGGLNMLSNAPIPEDCPLESPSWKFLMELLDDLWPEDVVDGSSGDPGPRLVVALRKLAEKDKTISGMTAVIMGHESTIINLERSLKRSAKQCEEYGVRIQELEADLKKESKDPPKDDEDKGG